MLSIGLITILVAIPLFYHKIQTYQFNRITAIIIIYAALLTYNNLIIVTVHGLSLYSGLYQVNLVTISLEIFILTVGSLLLIGWGPTNTITKSTIVPSINEYFIVLLFSTLGSTIVLSSYDLISIYLSIELQSFGVYILATIYRNSESSTSAGLNYFLLGGLSSAVLLLGTAIIYSYTGLTQFDSLFILIQVNESNTNSNIIVCGVLLIGVGFLFKIGSAPLHNWAPDVYDGVPTVVSSWLTTIPKISILIFILILQSGLQGNCEAIIYYIGDLSINIWKEILLIASLISLIIGTVAGLSQYKIKRLFAYSTISHVGFLLFTLSINTEESMNSFLFYLIQYSVTNANLFLILLGFGYILNKDSKSNSIDIQFIHQLKGQFTTNPILTISISVCLFSIAGIPPLIGFFGKQMILYTSMIEGYYYISLVSILVSVISATYYLKIVQISYFNLSDNGNSRSLSISQGNYITNIHSIVISTLTMLIILFVIQPNILLNSCNLLALSLFNN